MMLPPDPEEMNGKRSQLALITLVEFAIKNGMRDEVFSSDWGVIAQDLLVDLAHFCDRHEMNIMNLLRKAGAHYSA
jgi:hypothetical protein